MLMDNCIQSETTKRKKWSQCLNEITRGREDKKNTDSYPNADLRLVTHPNVLGSSFRRAGAPSNMLSHVIALVAPLIGVSIWLPTYALPLLQIPDEPSSQHLECPLEPQHCVNATTLSKMLAAVPSLLHWNVLGSWPNDSPLATSSCGDPY